MNLQRLALLALAASSLLPFAASAATYSWSHTDSGRYIYTILPITQPVETVLYGATLTDTNGIPVEGAIIPVGTCINATFKPHVSEDLSWFGTGYTWDSPFGEWAPQGIVPDDDVFNSGNLIGSAFVYNYYNAFGVQPPAETLSPPTDGFSCTGDAGSSMRCCATKLGQYNFNFNFAATIGNFNGAALETGGGAVGRKFCNASTTGSTTCFATTGATDVAPTPGQTLIVQAHREMSPYYNGTSVTWYRLDVPPATITIPITVGTADGLPPGHLLLSGGGAAQGAGQCTVSTPYSITMSATDPDNDQIRYGIDWDGNGTVDQFVPATGYVNSGTQESANRTFSTNGTKVIKILAQDNRGLTSGWSVLSVTCTGGQDQSQNQSQNSSSNSGSQSFQNTLPALTLRAIPSLVRSGQTTTLSWSASNVLGNSCKVTSAIDAAANGTGAWVGAISSGVKSSPITQQTTYTLFCTGLDNSTLTQSATVNIIPGFQEL